MTTPGHDGEHGGPMDRIKSVWRDAHGAREEHHDGGTDGGQARGGQHAPPGGPQPTESGAVPVAYQGPPRMGGPAGPVPLQSTPRGVPRILSRDGEHDNGHDGRPIPEPTVAQAVPWQAPRPMAQPSTSQQFTPQKVGPQKVGPQQVGPQQVGHQQVAPQPINQRPLPQRPAPPPLPQRSGPQPVLQPVPQPAPQPMSQPVPQPLPQRAAPPAEPDRNLAEPATTWHPVTPAAIDEPTEVAQLRPDHADVEPPATADLTGPQSATPASDTTPEPPSGPDAAADQELDELDDAADEGTADADDNAAEDPAPTPDEAVAQPAEPIRRPVWTEPERATPRRPFGADRAETPDRPMPALSPVPSAPRRLPSHIPSDIPSHITDAAAGAWTRHQNGASTRPQGRHELFDAPYREADSMPEPELVPSPPARAAADAAQVPAPAATPPANGQRFVAHDRATEFAARWSAVKSEFVDEPREAVRKADALVGELLADIARALAQQRAQLDRGLDTDGTSTEDLRQAMHRYREFFDRLITL